MPNDSEDYLGGIVTVGDSFTKRVGVSAYDVSLSELTTDGDYHDWDIKSIVPVGTKLVLVGSFMVAEYIGAFFLLQFPGLTSAINASMAYVVESNKIHASDHHVAINPTNRIIEYMAQDIEWSGLYFVVKGWWS